MKKNNWVIDFLDTGALKKNMLKKSKYDFVSKVANPPPA